MRDGVRMIIHTCSCHERACVCVCVRARACACTRAGAQAHGVCRARMCACACVRVCVCVYTRAPARARARARARVCVCVWRMVPSDRVATSNQAQDQHTTTQTQQTTLTAKTATTMNATALLNRLREAGPGPWSARDSTPTRALQRPAVAAWNWPPPAGTAASPRRTSSA